MTATFSPAQKARARSQFVNRSFLAALAAVGPLIAGVGRVNAQTSGVVSLVTLTSEAEERARLGQLFGQSSAGFLIRSASRLSPWPDSAKSIGVSILMPEVRSIRNSGIPFSLNDGALWAGRGWNEEVTAGIAAHAGPVRLIVAPTYVSEQNEIFQVIPYPQNVASRRNIWANPFHPLPESIDLPLRFGDRRIERWDPGQSSLTIDAGGTAFGAATENLWWGPGIRNAITLSNNAAGFPHLFVQTRHPVRTRAGSFDAQWILGELTESGFFDLDTANDKRSLNGGLVVWTPSFDTTLSVGIARLAMATQSGNTFRLSAAFDILRSAGHANVDTAAPVPATGRDQITSLFARWVLPGSGFEAYAEWARFEEPKSLRDFLESPGHSEGYTLGLQWAHPLAAQRAFRLQSEVSYLEPDPSLRVRPVATTYTSRGVPQGFTQRGETLGAAIGPGASSQWLAGDLFTPRWRIGAYLDRIRWDNGTLFENIVPIFRRQDVTLSAGVRGSVSFNGVTMLVDFGHAARFNYLYQAYILGPESFGGIDLVNNTLSVTLSTARWH